jgi:hypothetical protein
MGVGGIQLDPLGTAPTNRPIVAGLGDYDDGEIGGMMIGKGNRSIRKNLPQCRFVHHKSHVLPGTQPGPRGEKPATSYLSYTTVFRRSYSY